MEKEIHVYDYAKGVLRQLNKSNYDDDIVIGIVFLERSVLSVIQNRYRICGFTIIDNSGVMFPIDIQKDKVVMLEGTYNCLDNETKNDLIKFNICIEPKYCWSSFFLKWQFLSDWNALENNGSFIKMCSNIICDETKIQYMINNKIDIVFPITYDELCILVQNIKQIFNVDFFNQNYVEEVNYVVDALINGYHMHMSEDEILKYCYQLCNVVNEEMED